jgi:cyclic pyranopterin phosphate synthase
MVDVSAKQQSVREATASGEIQVQPATLEMITAQARGESTALKKGDAFSVAQLAGISAATKTWDLIPLCHPLPLESVAVDLSTDPDRSRVQITARVKTFARTGVEMEALTAVGVAALTLYDMCKSADKSMRIGNIRLVKKTGGSSGDFVGDD